MKPKAPPPKTLSELMGIKRKPIDIETLRKRKQ